MATRRGPGTTKGDDVLDLSGREPESTSLSDECEYSQNISRVTAVAGWTTLGHGQDTVCFVEP